MNCPARGTSLEPTRAPSHTGTRQCRLTSSSVSVSGTDTYRARSLAALNWHCATEVNGALPVYINWGPGPLASVAPHPFMPAEALVQVNGETLIPSWRGAGSIFSPSSLFILVVCSKPRSPLARYSPCAWAKLPGKRPSPDTNGACWPLAMITKLPVFYSTMKKRQIWPGRFWPRVQASGTHSKSHPFLHLVPIGSAGTISPCGGKSAHLVQEWRSGQALQSGCCPLDQEKGRKATAAPTGVGCSEPPCSRYATFPGRSQLSGKRCAGPTRPPPLYSPIQWCSYKEPVQCLLSWGLPRCWPKREGGYPALLPPLQRLNCSARARAWPLPPTKAFM